MTRIVIIGGGPAGYEAALVAAQHGGRVTLVEPDGIGGACVLFDCVPSKTFIASAGGRTDLRRADDLGIGGPRGRRPCRLPAVHGRVKGLAHGAVRRHPGRSCMTVGVRVLDGPRAARRPDAGDGGAPASRSTLADGDGPRCSTPTWC